MRKFLLTLLITLTTLFSFSQSGWQSGNYYQYQGQRVKEYDYYYQYNFQGGYQKRYRILQWEQQQYSGYIYVWTVNGWLAQYWNSYAWYCYWSNWYYENYYYPRQNYNYNYNYQYYYWNR
jgi:hypothetical protein